MCFVIAQPGGTLKEGQDVRKGDLLFTSGGAQAGQAPTSKETQLRLNMLEMTLPLMFTWREKRWNPGDAQLLNSASFL